MTLAKTVMVIGCSAGGTDALRHLFTGRHPASDVAVVVVMHVGGLSPNILQGFLSDVTGCPVKEAESQEVIAGGVLYFAPPGYHLLISPSKVFELNVDDPVNYSRPSIDVLFESAAEAYGPDLICLVLTGANHDGAHGAKMILAHGGTVLVQSPEEASHPQMPLAALSKTGLSRSYPLKELERILAEGGRLI